MKVTPIRMTVPLAITMSLVLSAQDQLPRVEQEAARVAPAVTELRHQIHQNPELSNREEKTAALVADYLRKVRTTYLGQEVGVMHACGHDIHTAVQLGVASVLTAMKATLPAP